MPKISLNIGILILAAGASKRMGVPKQMLNWGNTSLLSHAIETALGVVPKEIVVILGANYDVLKKDIKDYPVTVLNNLDWDKGLGTSIAKGVSYFENTQFPINGVLIMLADQPFVTSSFLESIIKNFVPNKNQIIATFYEEGKYGVPAIFDKVYFEELMALRDDYGAKYLLKKYESQVINLIPSLKNIDLDTQEDYKNAHNSKFKN
ncbi:nucleotidyltransferase family protein [Mariniflexile soesokkakense]|uniref:Nucleotidyltransferase family protein n=1 Tax=Mariniflexile soesokkakense TaxID=1343160 RepID=A0ABV0A7W6_9FLAO